jgi:hypothetical protein
LYISYKNFTFFHQFNGLTEVKGIGKLNVPVKCGYLVKSTEEQKLFGALFLSNPLKNTATGDD